MEHLQIGQKVRILGPETVKFLDWQYYNDLDMELAVFDDGSAFTRDMEPYAGRIATITGWDYKDGIEGIVYFLDIDEEQNFWTEEMFESK